MALEVKVKDDEIETKVILNSMPNSWKNIIMILNHVKFLSTDVIVVSFFIEVGPLIEIMVKEANQHPSPEERRK